MAAIAAQDQARRKIKVDRARLINQLTKNLVKHVKEYNEAVAGFKSLVLSKINEAHKEAKDTIESQFAKLHSKYTSMTDEELIKSSGTIRIMPEVVVRLDVPKSYAKEYEMAIDLFSWETEITVELTVAEFSCYVRDEWDWKENFEHITGMYKSLGASAAF